MMTWSWSRKLWIYPLVFPTQKVKPKRSQQLQRLLLRRKQVAQPTRAAKTREVAQLLPKRNTNQKKETKKSKENGKKKTTFRHRATSAAYHTAKKRALQQGQSVECARAAGRTASRKAAENIDSGILKDPDESSDEDC